MRLRFESFEIDTGTAELYKNGRRIRLQDQPARLLILLASRPRELVTRTDIQNALWEDGQFVEFEHAINVAIKKIREVLEDDPAAPRIIETLPRKGYRFIAEVEAIGVASMPEPIAEPQSAPAPPPERHPTEDELVLRFFLPTELARRLFLGVQVMYLAIYCTVLIRMMELSQVLADAAVSWLTIPVLVAATCGIPVRLYLLFTVGLRHPAAGLKYRRMLPYLMAWDWLWAASPFLAIETFGPGLSLVFTAMLVYPPVSQLILIRSLHPADVPPPPG